MSPKLVQDFVVFIFRGATAFGDPDLMMLISGMHHQLVHVGEVPIKDIIAEMLGDLDGGDGWAADDGVHSGGRSSGHVSWTCGQVLTSGESRERKLTLVVV